MNIFSKLKSMRAACHNILYGHSFSYHAPKKVKRSELISTSSNPVVAELERDLHAAALKQNGVEVEQ